MFFNSDNKIKTRNNKLSEQFQNPIAKLFDKIKWREADQLNKDKESLVLFLNLNQI
jgi:hypothetical protein